MEKDALGVTVYLLREDQLTAFEQRFPREEANALPLATGLDGRFVPLPAEERQPRWVKGIGPFLANPGNLHLSAKSPSGLLILNRAGRTFVLTFGHAWLHLEDEWLERDFGRRVALNLIGKDGLLEIRAEQVFAKWHVASERAPRATTVDEFGVEFDRDLVGAVEGIPKSKHLGRAIRGGTSLRLTAQRPALLQLLDRAEDVYKSNAYKKNWPDIDNLGPVKDQAIIAELERRLDRDLRTPARRRRIVMFTPLFRRDEPLVAESYVHGRLTKTAPRTPYLTIEGWVAVLARRGLAPSVAQARYTPVHLLDDAGEEVKACSALQCFGYEASLGGRQYVLASGIWYEVVDDFLKRVERSLAKIDAPTVTLPAWDQVEDEATYNARCCRRGGLLHFDLKKIRFGGGQSQFEFCDVFHPRRRALLFAKIASRSSGMSHLVEQVRRTAELLFSLDDGYRRELQKVFRKHHPRADATWLNERPRHGEWELSMISLGRSAGELPFFAKCSLMNLHRDLRERGHRVSFGRV